MRGIIFDLDGTLWTTEEAYIDTYKRISQEFSFERKNDDVVKSCLGLKLEQVVEKLFPKNLDAELIGIKCVQYVTEYCLKNPKFCSNNLTNIFEELSKKYDLYIMSNCPRHFLDGFLEVSGLSKFLENTFSITEGSKKEHLRKISKNFNERTLFVGDSQFDYDDIEDHKCIQFCYAKYGYLDCNEYEYHIDSLDDILNIVSKIEKKERMIDHEDYKIYSSKDTNVTVINFDNYSMFGFIEFSNKEDLDLVLKKIKREYKNKLIGPIDGKTWYSYRVCLDNFDWKLYPDCLSNQEINDCLIENGFELFHTYSSTLSNINEKVWKLAKRIKLPPEYTQSICVGEECFKHIKDLYEIATQVFEDADYYRNISFDDFKDIYMEGIKFVNPVLITISKNDKLVAFTYAYQDPEKRFYICKTIGIRQDERNKNIILKLLDISYDHMTQEGYTTVLHHFQNDRTKVMETLSSGYAIKKKSYGLFKYENK